MRIWADGPSEHTRQERKPPAESSQPGTPSPLGTSGTPMQRSGWSGRSTSPPSTGAEPTRLPGSRSLQDKPRMIHGRSTTGMCPLRKESSCSGLGRTRWYPERTARGQLSRWRRMSQQGRQGIRRPIASRCYSSMCPPCTGALPCGARNELARPCAKGAKRTSAMEVLRGRRRQFVLDQTSLELLGTYY